VDLDRNGFRIRDVDKLAAAKDVRSDALDIFARGSLRVLSKIKSRLTAGRLKGSSELGSCERRYRDLKLHSARLFSTYLPPPRPPPRVVVLTMRVTRSRRPAERGCGGCAPADISANRDTPSCRRLSVATPLPRHERHSRRECARSARTRILITCFHSATRSVIPSR